AWCDSISSTARSDADRRERKPRVRLPVRVQESSLPNSRCHRSRAVLRDRIPFLTGSSRASNVWASGPVTTHFSENCGWRGFTRTFHSPGVITVGTRSAGKSFALSHASPNARLTVIRLFQRTGKDLGVG